MTASQPAAPDDGARGPNAVRDLVDTDRELALLRELIRAASSGPGVEPLAAADVSFASASFSRGLLMS